MRTVPIPVHALENSRNYAEHPAHVARRGGRWETLSWSEYGRAIRQTARALIALGVTPGTPVAILGSNRPEWVISDVAAMAVGAVPFGIYTSSAPDEVEYLLNHSETPVLILDNIEQWQRMAIPRDRLPHLRHVVLMTPGSEPDSPSLSWESFLQAGEAVPEREVEARLASLQPDMPASLIYTSGTTGRPKAVMLSHENLAWTAAQAAAVAGMSSADRALSYLPLSHVAEQMFTIHMPAVAGSTVYYGASFDRLRDDLCDVRPTIFFGVPRVWEKFSQGITAELSRTRGARATVLRWAMGVGRQMTDTQQTGREPGLRLRGQHRVCRRFIYSGIRSALGLDHARLCFSGAAPIATELLAFLSSVGIPVLEVYGQSEGSGVATINLPGRTRYGTVGRSFPGVDVRIGEGDEILLRGPNVFLGYYKDADATADVLTNGWLRSGDLGRLDPDGYVLVTGRAKEIIITAGGKNIAPVPIEEKLQRSALIAQAVVIGDRRPYLTALISLDPESVAELLGDSVNHMAWSSHPVVLARLQQAVDDVNQSASRVSQIKKFSLLPRPLSVETRELTPTLKLKRSVVNEQFAALIDELYAG